MWSRSPVADVVGDQTSQALSWLSNLPLQQVERFLCELFNLQLGFRAQFSGQDMQDAFSPDREDEDQVALSQLRHRAAARIQVCATL